MTENSFRTDFLERIGLKWSNFIYAGGIGLISFLDILFFKGLSDECTLLKNDGLLFISLSSAGGNSIT